MNKDHEYESRNSRQVKTIHKNLSFSPSLEELFGRKRKLDWFKTIEEYCEKISYYL